ncbi:MAG: hypothetical protein NZ739_00580 [Verrucomicrobiae bacterium]|nr:hypothetical protein [Verrucomicrobiae bacterium]MCX7721801.1 hypothetical protein [Verrucomicrobiae bacterium]MDW7981031.1 hypothetical protein [Verrucomicrobiales bacterium]
MKWFRAITILSAAWLGVFLQAKCGITRTLLAAQLDVLPPLLVYTALTSTVGMVALVAVWGGLCLDALSANPLGVSILPLFVVGLAINRGRGLILHWQITARLALGAAAGAAVPTLTVLLLLTGGHNPLLSWGSVWQLLVMSASAAVLTPAVFKLFELVDCAFAYRPAGATSFRHDREIRRDKVLKEAE